MQTNYIPITVTAGTRQVSLFYDKGALIELRPALSLGNKPTASGLFLAGQVVRLPAGELAQIIAIENSEYIPDVDIYSFYCDGVVGHNQWGWYTCRYPIRVVRVRTSG
jgi:hypothetical protein